MVRGCDPISQPSYVLKESDITSPYFNEWFYSSSNAGRNESYTELVHGGTNRSIKLGRNL
ncbi:MAG: hypothetical protein IPN15_17885 [Saprospiraceae bacterium]|nr:hypothetical protein [Candidatus Vicinibacter affinis]